MAFCLLGLGSNLGDRRQILAQALASLTSQPEIILRAKSRLYESEAVGGPRCQPKYLNAVALVETSLSPEALLQLTQQLEKQAGRERQVRWGPRTLDIDLLFYDDVVVHSAQLRLPHPRLAFRRFVLEPAAEIVPTFRHPVFGLTVYQLLSHLDEAAPYLAITGPPGCGKSKLVQRLSCPPRLLGLYSSRGVFGDRWSEPRLVPPTPTGKRRAIRRLLGQESRLLFRRSQRLARHLARWKWTDVSSVRLVTDFWPWETAALLQTLCRWARRWPSRLRQLVSATAAQFSEMLDDYFPAPKLLVHLDYSPSTLSSCADKVCLPNAIDLLGPAPQIKLQQLAVALRRQVNQSSRGPWLRLVDLSLEDAYDEVQVAIQAMENHPIPLRES